MVISWSPRVFWVRKKGNSSSVVRHARGYFYIQRRKNSSVNSDTHRKLQDDLRITRNNNSIYRKMVSGEDQWSIVKSVSRDSQPHDIFWASCIIQVVCLVFFDPIPRVEIVKYDTNGNHQRITSWKFRIEKWKFRFGI